MTRDEIESASAIEEKLKELLAQVKCESFLAMASQVMEIYEMFDKAAAVSLEYGKGFQDGFWASRELDSKYQLAKVESLVEKSSAYFEH